MSQDEKLAALREDVLTLYVVNKRLDLLDVLRAEIRSEGVSGKSLDDVNDRMAQLIQQMGADAPLADERAEARRQQFQKGLQQVTDLLNQQGDDAEKLKAFSDQQQQQIEKRLEKDGVDFGSLDPRSRQGLTKRALDNLMHVEGLLGAKEYYQAAERDAQLSPEPDQNALQEAQKKLRQLDFALRPFAPKKPAAAEAPERDEPGSYFLEPEPEEGGVPLPRDPAPPAQGKGNADEEDIIISIDPTRRDKGALEYILGRRWRFPLKLNDEDSIPEFVPSEKPDPAARDPESLKKNPYFNPEPKGGKLKDRSDEPKSTAVDPGQVFEGLKNVPDSELAAMASKLPATQEPPMPADKETLVASSSVPLAIQATKFRA